MARATLDDRSKKKVDDTGTRPEEEKSAGALADILTALQRTAGNRAVTKMVESGSLTAAGPAGGLLASLASLFRWAGAAKAPSAAAPPQEVRPKYFVDTSGPGPTHTAAGNEAERAQTPGPAEEAKSGYGLTKTAEELEADRAQPAEPVEEAKSGYGLTKTAEELEADRAQPAEPVEEAKSGYGLTKTAEELEADRAQPAEPVEEAKSGYGLTKTAEELEAERAAPAPPPAVAAVIQDGASASTASPTPPATAARTPEAGPRRGRNYELTQMRLNYKGENLSVAEAQQKGLKPTRAAVDAKKARVTQAGQAAKKVDALVAELEAMARNGEAKGAGTAEYIAKLKEAAGHQTTENKAIKNLKDLGLDHSDAEMAEYKVAYLETADQRDPYVVRSGAGGLVQGVPPTTFDTSGMTSYGAGSGWAAFVMDPGGVIYAAEHRVQRFHHSSFLAGGDVAAAGEIKVVSGQLKAITNKTGHYWAGREQMGNVLEELDSMGVRLVGVAVFLHEDGRLEEQEEDARQWLDARRAAGTRQ